MPTLAPGTTVTVHNWPYTGWDGRTGIISEVLCTGMCLVRFEDSIAGIAPEYLEPAGTAKHLRIKLRAAGLSELTVASVWPDWWVPEAEDSPSARLELRFAIARQLRIDPQKLAAENDRVIFMDQLGVG